MALKRWFKRITKIRTRELDPDEIFLDAKNLPSFDKQQFEGQIEKPINKSAFHFFIFGCALIMLVLLGRIFSLQVISGSAFALRSESNNLRHTAIFPERGIIYDRAGVELAWNDPDRKYKTDAGLSHVLGFIGYPSEKEIKNKQFDPKQLVGREGVEKIFDNILGGEKGIKIEEINVAGQVVTNHLLTAPESGKSVVLSIDSKVQTEFFRLIKELAQDRGFKAGAGIIMDVETGELLALASYPEYDSNVLSAGTDRAAINRYVRDSAGPFLNRAISGLYTPGSIIKPFVASAALVENIISPTKTIVSTGQLVVPNPYDPKHPSIFKDWKAHGAVDMRHALAVSSDVYFYEIGGGFGSQAGLGIKKIDDYVKLFGFGTTTGLSLAKEEAGVIPTPEWKEENFPGEPWRLGDTYHTVIGQYGFLVTPIQVARGIAGIATNKLVQPTLLKNDGTTLPTSKSLPFDNQELQIVREGMRLAVTEGTAKGLNTNAVMVAAKTGTAELGTLKEDVNSWVVGFFPYQKPRYAFVVVMEKGSRSNLVGGVAVMRRLFDWLAIYAPNYLTPAD